MQKSDIDKDTIFLTITGSQAYGTSTPESDLDLRGVAIMRDKKYYLGFNSHFEQYSTNEPDLTIYNLQKAFHLMANCNPNMIELLFVDDKSIQKITKYWERILEHKEKFLSKKARFSYTGYAFAQMKRIKTGRNWLLSPPTKKPERSDYGLPEEKLLKKEDLGAFNWVLVHLLKDSIDYLNFSDETKEELQESNFIGRIQQKGVPESAFDQVQKITGASDEWMTTMQKEQAYMNAKRQWSAYMSWKESRNKKRAVLEEKFGYDTKHALHLVRLARTGYEVLTTRKLIVRRPDAEELLAIRNGAWTYEQLEEYLENMQEKINAAYDDSALPHSPDRPFLDNLCSEIIEEYLNDNG